MNNIILCLYVSMAVMFSLIYPADAADFTKAWTCGSGLGCGGSCQGNAYMGMSNNNYGFTFTAEPGIYSCDVKVKNTWFAFSGTKPETNEYSDVYLNSVDVGKTNDLFCNTLIEDEGCTPAKCDANIDGCKWYFYEWYDTWTGKRCDGPNACQFYDYGGGHSCAGPGLCPQANQPGYYKTYFFTPFGSATDCTGIYSNCCSIWYHGRTCGECDPDMLYSGSIKSPKYCGDNNYGSGDCSSFGNLGDVKCYWDDSNIVLAGLAGKGMPDNDNDGVLCSAAATAEGDGGKYMALLGVYHFGNDDYFKSLGTSQYDTNYICCFAKDGSLEKGMHCVRNKECGKDNGVQMKCLVVGTTTECENSSNPNRQCTCGGTGEDGGNTPPGKPAVTGKTSCTTGVSCGPFTATATDADGDNIRYRFNWGDSVLVWVPSSGTVTRGTMQQSYHTYTTADTYNFRVRANDIESNGEWSNIIQVTVTGGGYESHRACVGHTCEEVSGAGEDECETDKDCEEIELASDGQTETGNIRFSPAHAFFVIAGLVFLL